MQKKEITLITLIILFTTGCPRITFEPDDGSAIDSNTDSSAGATDVPEPVGTDSDNPPETDTPEPVGTDSDNPPETDTPEPVGTDSDNPPETDAPEPVGTDSFG
jgi:hypothetical protein